MIRPYQALATDYDGGTLAHQGTVSAENSGAIDRLLASGKEVGAGDWAPTRSEPSQVFPDIGLCDFVVAENGALLYWPTTGRIKVLAEPAPAGFAQSSKCAVSRLR